MRKTKKRWNAQQATYRQRDLTLLKLGFANYAEYLASTLWLCIRQQVFSQARGLCRICHSPAVAVHHICPENQS